MNPSLATLVAAFVLVTMVFFAMFWPGHGGQWLDRLEGVLARCANSRWTMAGIAGSIFIFSAGLHLGLKLPEPSIHDEFAYLLQADTFAHGRLANPPHPMAKFFENFHIIFQPTYASKYPPGQGLFLALGQILGRPIIGVWLSTALAGAAMFWMLSGLFSRSWALAGTVIAFFNPQVLMWNWSFWGGSVAWLGGALALGGSVRLWNTPAVRPAIIMGMGMGILSLSRPYEGMLLSLMLLLVCGGKAWKQHRSPGLFFRRCLWPAGCALLPFVLFQGWYNYHVTGSATKLPYNIYDAAYSRTPTFIWQSPGTNAVVHRNPQMARMYREWTYPEYERQRTLPGFLTMLAFKLSAFRMYVWNGLVFLALLPLAMAVGKRRESRLFLWLLLGVAATTFIGPVGAWPHYTAPDYPLLIALLVFSLQELRTWRRENKSVGRWLVPGVALLFCVHGCWCFFETEKAGETQWQFKRASLLAQMESDGKKHLVVIKYGPGHNFNEGWVWNRADIDHARVVWATDLGGEQDRELFDYFKGYEINRLEPDKKSPASSRPTVTAVER